MNNKIGMEKSIADIKTTWLRVAVTVIMVVIMFVPFLIYGAVASVCQVIYGSVTCIVDSYYETKN